MNQRVGRVSGEIRQILSEVIVRGEIKDPRVHDAGLITITHVRLTADLREATVLFIVHGLDAERLEGVRWGLQKASGFLRHRLGRELPLRFLPNLHFQVDQVFEQESKVDRLLAEVSKERADSEAAVAESDATNSEPSDSKP